jgi:hypothetical protein
MPKSVFEKIELTWKGETYVIPPNRVLRAIAKIEECISSADLAKGEHVPFSKAAMAYAAVLRYAGAKVTDDEVYEALWDNNGAAGASNVVIALWMMMIPPAQRRKLEAAVETNTVEDATEEVSAGNGSPTKAS